MENAFTHNSSPGDKFREKMKSYSRNDNEKKWLDENSTLVRKLFENTRLRDFVFEPFKGVFKYNEDDLKERIMSTITQVAIANAVIAGLPGKLGIGVVVSICLEAWMAFTIAKSVGFKINTINDVWKYMGLLGGVAVTILILFKQLLGFAFSLFNMIGLLPATVLAELLVTNLVGVLFWFAFEEAKKNGTFKIRLKRVLDIKKSIKDLYNHQKDFIKALGNKENIKLVGKRIKLWLTGDIVNASQGMRGEVFAFASMAYLLEGKYDELNGPLGKTFIESIQRAYSNKLGDATLAEMRDFFEARTPEQLNGDVNLVKGEMFEHLVEDFENADGDEWLAELHDDRTVPGSDIIFTNIETGEEIEVSLKSTDSPDLIERALERYPDTPILTTKEAEEYFGDNPMIDYSDIEDAELEEVTEENFEKLVEQLEPISAVKVAAAGVVSRTIASVWPFIMAYIRKRITYSQLNEALIKIFGESGVSLTSRISFAIILGPVFAWYLLARSIIKITKATQSLPKSRRVLVNV